MSCALTSLSSFTPASVLDSKYGRSAKSGTSEIKCANGSGRDTLIRFAGILSQLSKSGLIFIYLLISCVPQSRLIKQILQPGWSSHLGVFSSSRLYSRKENAALAEVISQIPYPRLVAFSGVGRRSFSVSHTVNAVIVEWKYNVARHDDCPKCVSIVWLQIRYVEVPKQLAYWSSVRTVVFVESSDMAR